MADSLLRNVGSEYFLDVKLCLCKRFITAPHCDGCINTRNQIKSYNCADRESNRRHPDYGLDAISTRPCFHDKNLSHSTSLSLCLHIAPSLLILCQSGFSRYRSQFLVDPFGRQFPTKCRIGILPGCKVMPL